MFLELEKKPKIPQSVEDRAIRLKQAIPQKIENIPPQELGDTIDQVVEAIDDLDDSLDEAGLGIDIGVDTSDLFSQNIHDTKRENNFFKTIGSQTKLTAAKISNYDEQLARLKAERDRLSFNREDGVNEERLREINNQIEELRQQREIQYKHLNRDLLPRVKSQFARIRETVNTMLYSDRTLGERIRTLFCEQGLLVSSLLGTIVSSIIALGTSIALGIENATPNPKPKPKPDPTPGPTPEPTPGSKNWIKKMLEKIKNILIKLGDKSA